MKLIHTSDWHLGRTLSGRKRYEEFSGFLDWLAQTIEEECVDALFVAGDVFDTSMPSNRSQELYYRFLCKVSKSCCRHIVIVAGNHDSPSFLGAPKALLKTLNVHVVSSASNDFDDEIVVLRNEHGTPELIVCAVPYLRDRDIRTVEAGESIEDKDRKLFEGIRNHYADIVTLADQKRTQQGGYVPVIATGHLFTDGGQTVDGDGVRELYVGSLAHVTTEIFPDTLNYVALGHLHVPQVVNGSERIRYSGSPLPMGFGEARQQKSVCLVDVTIDSASVQVLNVPVFQKLERVRGNWEELSARILELSALGSDAWLEVIYEGDEVISDLRERLDAAVDGTEMEIVLTRNNRIINQVLQQFHDEETLDDLNTDDVFERCLSAHNVPDEQRPELLRAYQEIVTSIDDDDTQAE
ncbi:MAG: exonuclease subunit SbcD [Proteobacteria bacterium]|nr:exonuclease subunit SbcD [Pseudomonadota bacterium]